MELKDKISVQDFQKIHDELGWKRLDNKVVKKSLENSMITVSAVENGQTVGIARVIGDGISHGLLADVCVLPKYQHKGIGTAMINHISEKLQAIADQNDEFLLELLPTAGKEDFYVKCGFKHKPENMAGCYLWFKNSATYAKGSKKYVLHLNKRPFDMIKRKRKTVEMRLLDEKRQIYKENDILIFVNRENENKVLKTRIVKLHKFKNFAQLYKAIDKTKLGYNKNEVAKPEDMEKYYSQEAQQKYGVVGIEIELL